MNARTGLLPTLGILFFFAPTVACEATSGEPAPDDQALEVRRSSSALDELEQARRTGSEAGSALSDSEAYSLALALCSPGACEPPSRELVAGLDDVAANTRVAAGSWWNLRE